MNLPKFLMATLDGYSATRATDGESGGKVYRLCKSGSRALYLKFGSGRVATDILNEAVRLRWLNDHLPSPQIRHFGYDGKRAWLLTAALPGRSGYECLVADQTSPSVTVRAIASFLRRLHEVPSNTCPFNSDHQLRMIQARRNIDEGLVDESDFAKQHQGWTAEQVWTKLRALVPQNFDQVVTHGDFSIGNIFVDRGKVTGVIDVGRLGIADPYQDLAIVWQNLSEFGSDLQQTLFEAYGERRLDKQRLEFHLCLDELF